LETSTQKTSQAGSAVALSAEEDPGYRTISGLSLVSLLVGLAAPLCLMAPLLFVIPIVGLIVAFLAIRRIDTSDGTLIGRLPALVALALCVASLCAAFTRTALAEKLLSRQARSAALEWFQLLQQGDVQSAFELTTDSRQLPPSGPPGSPAAQPELPSDPVDRFRVDPFVHFMLVHAKEAPVQFVQDLAFSPGVRGAAQVQQEFRVAAAEDGSENDSTTVELTLQRVQAGAKTMTWLVSGYRSDGLTPHEHH